MLVSGRKAFIDEMLMMTPSPCLAMCLPKTWLGRIVPRQLRSKTMRIASAGRSKNVVGGVQVASFLLPPAPLISTSTRPRLSSAAEGFLDAPFPGRWPGRAAPCRRPLRFPCTVRWPRHVVIDDGDLCAALGQVLAIAPHRTPAPPVITMALSFTSNKSVMLSFPWH